MFKKVSLFRLMAELRKKSGCGLFTQRSMNPRVISIVFCVGWILLVFLVVYFSGWVFEPINGRIFDWKRRLRPIHTVSEKIVHLDIDDKATQEYGLWPWGREMSAEIIKRLTEFHARLIVFDIFYASQGKDQAADNALFSAIADSGRVISATALGLSHSSDPDFKVEENDPKKMALYKRAWNIEGQEGLDLYTVEELRDSYIPLARISEKSRGVGHISSTPDVDGVNRRIPLIVRMGEKIFPSLALSALAEVLEADSHDIRISGKGEIQLAGKSRNVKLPVDERGMFIVNWGRPWETFDHYSAKDLLSDEPDDQRSDRYKGKIVIVGVTATGATDMGPTPISSEYPLSRIHSNALNTMLTGGFIRSVSPLPILVGLAALLSLFLPVITYSRGLAAGISMALVIIALFIAGAIIMGLRYLIEIPMAEFMAVFAPCALVTLGSEAIRKEMEANRVARALERYLSPDMLDKIVKEEQRIDLSTKRLVLTVVFVDMVKFSTMAQTMEVDDLSEFLNEYFESITEVIFEAQGTVDKFLGDGVMAFFGEPVKLRNHAQNAVKAAVRMQEEMGKLSKKWSAKGIKELKDGARIRIGINTGPLVVGNVGSSRRMEYTCLGSTVNIASRLQTQASEGGIVISANTMSLIDNSFRTSGPRWVTVKGLTEPIEVYDVDPFPEEKLAPNEPL